MPVMTEKLQKVVAHTGIGSRREIERWIAQGRLSVNGVRAELGVRVTPTDVVCIDGRRVLPSVSRSPGLRVLAYNKPRGEVCTRWDPQQRPTVFNGLPRLRQGRWVAIGRLDINTSGLLLFTNAGELAHRLMHPSAEVEREYAVRVFGALDRASLDSLEAGIELEDGKARFESVRDAGGEGINHWYHVVLKEGRNREVRRLWMSQGIRVSRLIRIRYGPIRLSQELRAGYWEELTSQDVTALARTVGLHRQPGAKNPSAPHGKTRQISRKQRKSSKRGNPNRFQIATGSARERG